MGNLNILECETRTGIFDEYRKFLECCRSGVFDYNSKSLLEVIDMYFITLPFVGTSRDHMEYFEERGIKPFPVPSQGIYIDNLYFIQFIMIFFSWAASNKDTRSKECMNILKSNTGYIILIRKTIDRILELANYCLYFPEEDEALGFNIPYLAKRDADIDSILPLVDKPVSLDILSFLDFRIENDLKEKEAIITRLYKNVLEKDKVKLKESNNGLYSDAKFLANFVSRHYNGDVLSDDQKLKICNDTFILILHLIRSVEVDLSRKENKKLIEQIKNEMNEDGK